MKVIEVKEGAGRVETGGAAREVSFMLLDNVKIGEYVLVHAGFAIQKIDEEEARATLALFKELTELV